MCPLVQVWKFAFPLKIYLHISEFEHATTMWFFAYNYAKSVCTEIGGLTTFFNFVENKIKIGINVKNYEVTKRENIES